MTKVTRPTTDVNIDTKKLGTNAVGNSSMGAFHRAKLMTAIRARRTDSKTVALKKLSYFIRTIHFSTLIEAHISSVVTSKTVGNKAIMKILQRNSLGLESFTPYVLREVISD